MKLYTRGGDKGQTSLFGGERVAKCHPRIEAYGTVDELNAYVGLLADQEVNKQSPVRTKQLQAIQHNLFVISAHLATPAGTRQLTALPELPATASQALEQQIDAMSTLVTPLRHFILPGGHVALSMGHVVRCVCRRAERCITRLQEAGEVLSADLLPYMNRLSDYLFMFTRVMAKELAIQEQPWIPRKKIPKKEL